MGTTRELAHTAATPVSTFSAKGVAPVLCRMGPESAKENRVAPKKEGAKRQLQVLTLNMDGIKNEMQNLLTWMRLNNIDVAAIQETHLQKSKRIEEYVGKARNQGYLMWTLEKPGRGQAILVRQGMALKYACHNDLDNQIQRVEMEDAAGPVLWIFHVYGASSSHERKLQKEALRGMTGGAPENCRMMVLGDFNMTATPKFDRWSAFAVNQPKGERMIEGKEWIDVYKKANPEERGYTHAWCRNTRDGIAMGASRIDHIWIKENPTWAVTKCDITPVTPSDHEAVVASLSVEGGIAAPIPDEGGYTPSSRKLFKEAIPKRIQAEIENRLCAMHGCQMDVVTNMLQQVIGTMLGVKPLGHGGEIKEKNSTNTSVPRTIILWRKAVILKNKMVKVAKGWWKPTPDQLREMEEEKERVGRWAGGSIKRGGDQWAEIIAINRATKILMDNHHKVRDDTCNQEILKFMTQRDKELEEGKRDLHRSVKATPRFHPATVLVIDPGKGVTRLAETQEEYKQGMAQYFQELYANSSPEVKDEVEQEPTEEITLEVEELERTRKRLKNGKRPGISEIQAEIVKPLTQKALKTVAEAFQSILNHPETLFPQSWREELISLIYKKDQPNMLKNYRGIVLLDTFYKWFALIIKERILQILKSVKMPFQAGGLPQRRVEENVWLGRAAMEEATKNGTPLVMAFIDLEKAFDRVPPCALVKALRIYRIPAYIVRIVKAIYRLRKMSVCTKYGLTDWFQAKSGIKQGCPLSPLLFALFMNMIIDEIIPILGKRGVVVKDDVQIIMLAFMDDLTLFASSMEDMQRLVNELTKVLRAYDMTINQDKSGWLALNVTPTELLVEQSAIPMVDATNAYKWLGLWTTGDMLDHG
jgi:exonuclease III